MVVRGKELALYGSMFFVSIRMRAGAQKRQELAQTIASLMGAMRRGRGCTSCGSYQSLEDENEFRVIGEWSSREELVSHLKSDHFKVLMGTTHLLDEPHELTMYEVVATDKGGDNGR